MDKNMQEAPQAIDASVIRKVESSIVTLEDFPKYDLFLSQVIEFIEDLFPDDAYTVNIIQNYIKSEVISKPAQGRKKGYTKIHLIQLIFVSYMRPVLSTEEIKKVFQLAFNDINDRSDDILSWEDAYRIFYKIQVEQLSAVAGGKTLDVARLNHLVSNLTVPEKDKTRITTFITVLSLIARASFIKRTAKDIINQAE